MFYFNQLQQKAPNERYDSKDGRKGARCFYCKKIGYIRQFCSNFKKDDDEKGGNTLDATDSLDLV